MNIEAFLEVADQFRLGELETEQPHPETVGLAEQAQSDLPAALEAFQRVDEKALGAFEGGAVPLAGLAGAMSRVLDRGGRIYLAGCGATGRLALSLEVLAREAWLAAGQRDRVHGFMAGGDAALIRSIESFEDFPEYGARQLMESGFGEGDLLVAITEGGETPFVIGACLKAAEMAREDPWFLFCNPPDTLKRLAKRSRTVLEHPRVRPFCLRTGPMALAGSTRLQATTVQMLAAGAALSEALGGEPAESLVARFRAWLGNGPREELVPFIEEEAAVYAAGERVLYQTDDYGITVLTDTTERAPTFSLAPFEHRRRGEEPASLCYLSLPGTPDAGAAWRKLLRRPPRTLEWESLADRASKATLLGYDISGQAAAWREARCPGLRQHSYHIGGGGPVLDFRGHRLDLKAGSEPLLVRHLALKCALNRQSTLAMGRLGCFESNLMTRVRPSNYKLVDRAARHVQHAHRQQTGQDLPYAEAVRQVFEAGTPELTPPAGPR